MCVLPKRLGARGAHQTGGPSSHVGGKQSLESLWWLMLIFELAKSRIIWEMGFWECLCYYLNHVNWDGKTCGCHCPLTGILNCVNEERELGIGFNSAVLTSYCEGSSLELWANRNLFFLTWLLPEYFITGPGKEIKTVPQTDEWSDSLSHRPVMLPRSWWTWGKQRQGLRQAGSSDITRPSLI